jgi:hypothetical protein
MLPIRRLRYMQRYSARKSLAGTTKSFMIETTRHVPLRSESWEQDAAVQANDEIVADALDQFGDDPFWPEHPLDGGVKDGHSSTYFGAAGVIWALEYLKRAGATKVNFDFRPYLLQLLERTKTEMATYNANFKDYAKYGSLLFLIMRPEPSSSLVD